MASSLASAGQNSIRIVIVQHMFATYLHKEHAANPPLHQSVPCNWQTLRDPITELDYTPRPQVVTYVKILQEHSNNLQAICNRACRLARGFVPPRKSGSHANVQQMTKVYYDWLHFRIDKTKEDAKHRTCFGAAIRACVGQVLLFHLEFVCDRGLFPGLALTFDISIEQLRYLEVLDRDLIKRESINS